MQAPAPRPGDLTEPQPNTYLADIPTRPQVNYPYEHYSAPTEANTMEAPQVPIWEQEALKPWSDTEKGPDRG